VISSRFKKKKFSKSNSFEERQKLRELSLRPSKGRGQNFITDPSLIQRIVDFAGDLQSKALVEIGPGLGALTKQLYRISPSLKVIEIEPQFCSELKRNFPDLTIVNQDVRQVQFSSLGSDLFVFGNLPYSFSTEIVFHLISQREFIASAVLMLQREFVERMCAAPGGRNFGTLSIGVQLWCELEAGPVVPGDAFYPPAKVESQVVKLNFLKAPRFPISDHDFFRKVVKASFLQRRRKLQNSLKNSGLCDPAQVEAALRSAAIDGGRRAETLSIEEFVRLSEVFRLQKTNVT